MYPADAPSPLAPPADDPNTPQPSAWNEGDRSVFKRRRWLWPAGVALAFVLGTGMGAAAGGDPESSPEFTALAEERDTLREELTAAEARASEAEDEISAAEERAATAEEAAERRSAELDEREADLDGRETEIAEQEVAVEEREAAVTTTEERVAETQIHNGIWTVGVDVEPGTYRVADAVNDRCYWAILRTGSNGSDIVENDIPSGGFPTVTLSEGQDFENSCGVWNKQ